MNYNVTVIKLITIMFCDIARCNSYNIVITVRKLQADSTARTFSAMRNAELAFSYKLSKSPLNCHLLATPGTHLSSL